MQKSLGTAAVHINKDIKLGMLLDELSLRMISVSQSNVNAMLVCCGEEKECENKAVNFPYAHIWQHAVGSE